MSKKFTVHNTPPAATDDQIMQILYEVLQTARDSPMYSIGIVYSVKDGDDVMIEAYHDVVKGGSLDDILDGIYMLEKEVGKSIRDEDGE